MRVRASKHTGWYQICDGTQPYALCSRASSVLKQQSGPQATALLQILILSRKPYPISEYISPDSFLGG